MLSFILKYTKDAKKDAEETTVESKSEVEDWEFPGRGTNIAQAIRDSPFGLFFKTSGAIVIFLGKKLKFITFTIEQIEKIIDEEDRARLDELHY